MDPRDGGADELAGLLTLPRSAQLGQGYEYASYYRGPRTAGDARQADGSVIFPDGSRHYGDGRVDPPGWWTFGVAYPEGPVFQPGGGIILPDGSGGSPLGERLPPGTYPRGGHTSLASLGLQLPSGPGMPADRYEAGVATAIEAVVRDLPKLTEKLGQPLGRDKAWAAFARGNLPEFAEVLATRGIYVLPKGGQIPSGNFEAATLDDVIKALPEQFGKMREASLLALKEFATFDVALRFYKPMAPFGL